MSLVLKRFLNQLDRPVVTRAEGAYLYLSDGRRILDATAGSCSQHVLGFSHPAILKAMHDQMGRFCHIDYTSWCNPMLEELADLVLSRAPKGLDRVYFSGTSGSEATEAAMKLSYQVHLNEGKPRKTYYISREQSYHGATLQSIAASSQDNFSVYEPLLPRNHAKISPHYPLRHRRDGETMEEYSVRGARELEEKILELGPDRVCAFVGETMLGSLIGDVPPAPGYWKLIREVCDRYDVHVILDEIYCGLGRSGRIYCCDWDGITPDFICLSKGLSAGYAPLSAVVTCHQFEESIKLGQARINHGHTFQGYSLGCAASLAVQRIIHQSETLLYINEIGERVRSRLREGLGTHPFVREVRGRGSLSALEYETRDNSAFGAELGTLLEEEYGILVSAKWHRISLPLPFIVTRDEIDRICDAVVEAFGCVARRWG